MGWNSWNHFGCDGLTEELVRETADAIVSSGLRDAGYDVVTLDDCWSSSGRDDSGNLTNDPTKFPSGMKAIGDYIHGLGLRYGIYASIGTRTCAGRPGSLDHEFRDVATFASWGVDYIKADRCSAEGRVLKDLYARWRDAIVASGRPILLSASDNNPPDEPWAWGPVTAHQWRMSGDIVDAWTTPPYAESWQVGMIDIFDRNAVHGAATAPGAYNDPDMLQVGNGGMTDVEYRTHFGLWALMSAPLIAGNDVRTMRPAIRDILTHAEVIAIDQDPLAFQAIRAGGSGPEVQVWYKPLSEPGARAVGLLNRGDSPILIAVDWTDLGLAPGDASVRDVWARTDRGTFRDGYSVGVEPHGLALLRVVGTERPVSEGFLSDQPWTYMANEIGPVERDESNGGSGAGDGHSIRMNDVTYAKGLGAHAPSAIEFRLDGVCMTFTAAVGVDDEVGDSGSVLFQVWGDGERLFETEVLTGATPAQEIAVDISGRRSVRLQVVSADTTTGDLADWADARVTCDPSAPPNRPPVITSFRPDSRVVMGTSESRTFTVVATDPDGDPLTYSWRINGTSVAGSGSAFTFVGTVVGTYLVAVVASDGLASVGHTWTVGVQADPAPEEPPAEPGRRGVSVVGVAVFASLAVTGAILAWILRPRTR